MTGRSLDRQVEINDRGVFVDGEHLPLWVAVQPITIDRLEEGLYTVTLTLLTEKPPTVAIDPNGRYADMVVVTADAQPSLEN
ncbi:hypothetical protein ACWEOE_10840 [Amycolatopsis sp. NPDC004368]